jgi:hypothetical protein
MRDVGTLLREHYDAVAPAIDIERLADRLAADESPVIVRPRWQGPAIAVGVACLLLLLIGGFALLMPLSGDEPPVTEPPTTVPGPATVGAFTVLETEGDVGTSATVGFGADGVPFIFHTTPHNADPGLLKITTCADEACTSAAATTAVAEFGRAESGIRVLPMADFDDRPFIVWAEYGDTAEEPDRIRAFKCGDPACAAGEMLTVTNAGWFSQAAAAGADGRPVIAYRTGDAANEWEGAVSVVKCADPGCREFGTPHEIPGSADAWSSALVTGDDGNPILALGGGDRLRIVSCLDAECALDPTVETVVHEFEFIVAMELSPDGNPIILTGGMSGTFLVACGDPGCAAAPTVTEFSPASTEDVWPVAMAVANDGSVVVAGQADGDFRMLRCPDPSCEGSTSSVVGVGVRVDDLSVGLTSEGLPVFAAHVNSDLGLMVCTDPICAASSVEPVSSVPSSDWELRLLAEGDVQTMGASPSLAVDPDGNPVAVYLGRTAEPGPGGEPVAAPKLLTCADPACSSSTVTILERGFWPAMAMRPNGLPVVAASDWNSEFGDVVVTWCRDPVCTETVAETVGQGGFGSPPAIVAGQDGSTVVAYQNIDDFYLYIASCGASSCAGVEPIRVDALADADGTRWFANNVALAVLPDRRPVAAFPQGNGELRYVECLDTSCSQTETQTIRDGLLENVTATITVGANGLPVLAYYADGRLEVASCGDTSCAQVAIASLGTALASWTSSVSPSISILPDGRPLVAYWAADGRLLLAECLDTACSSSTVGTIADVGTYDLTVGADGSPVVIYYTDSEMEPPPSADPEMWLPMTDLRFARCVSGTCTGG